MDGMKQRGVERRGEVMRDEVTRWKAADARLDAWLK